VVGCHDVEWCQHGFENLPNRLGVLPQALMLIDGCGCLAGRGQVALVQFLGLLV
jgi:hypothetical protein